MNERTSLPEKLQTALRLDRAVRLVWTSAPRWTLINLILVLVQGVLPLVALYLMKRIVDEVAAGLLAPDRASAFQQVAMWILLAGAVALLTAVFRSLAELAGQAQSLVVTDAISDILHAQSIAVDL
jgi:ATP-binding cassette subfamily B protein